MIFKTEKHTYKIKYWQMIHSHRHYLMLQVANNINHEWEDTEKFHVYNTYEEMKAIIEKSDDEIVELFKAYVEEFENEEALRIRFEKRFNS